VSGTLWRFRRVRVCCIALAVIVRWLRAVGVVDKELVTSEIFATGLLKRQRVVA
jgi:hypothetical protein